MIELVVVMMKVQHSTATQTNVAGDLYPIPSACLLPREGCVIQAVANPSTDCVN